jgi:hypothetical protein
MTQNATVPAGVNAAYLDIVGGHGGVAAQGGGFNVDGGDGAEITGRIAVNPGEKLSVRVGGAGMNGSAAPPRTNLGGAWGATGYGGPGGSSGAFNGASGAGASGVFIGTDPVAIAGGGGGAGGAGFVIHGGAGGSSGATVDAGHAGNGPGAGGGGGGGTESSGGGGAGGDSNPFAQGGGGGGGGAGYRGGGGGGGGGIGGGGGGGGGAGSSYIPASGELGLVTLGRASDSLTDGFVTITWADLMPACFAQNVDVPNDSPGVAVHLSCTADTRPDSFRILSGPSHGTLRNVNLQFGVFGYVPQAGYAGLDTITFSAVAAGIESPPETVTFVVAQQCYSQTVPVAQNTPGLPVQLHCSESTAPTMFELLTLPAHGFLDDRDLANGTFTYVPVPGFTGTDSLTFDSVTDDPFASQPATVTFIVTVMPRPSMILSANGYRVVEGSNPVFTVVMPGDATGYVGFYDTSFSGADKGIGVAPLVDGVATLVVPTRPLILGENIIQASYGGSSIYVANDSNRVTVTVVSATEAVPVTG